MLIRSRQVVLASVFAALLTGTMFMVPEIRFTMAAAFLVVALLSRWSVRAATALVFGAAFITPGLLRLTTGYYYGPEAFVWMAALAALVGVRSWNRDWAIPSPLRWPLTLWSLVAAFTWPVIAFRESNFSPMLMQSDPRFAGAVWIAASWTATVALNHMLGILWFDWLCRECGDDGESFLDLVAVPLTVSWVLTLLLSVYQALVDVAFANGGVHVLLGRASGGLMDANPFGVCTALWAPVVYLLCTRKLARWGQLIGVAALAFSWFGMWVSGSRGALGAAVIGLVTVVIAEVSGERKRRLWTLAFLGVAAVAVTAVIAVVPVKNSPIHRLMPLINGYDQMPLTTFIANRWDPYFYGRTASRMLEDSPLFGIGLGSFPNFVGQYSTLLGHVPLAMDNAQNWFRHQVTELGLVGSIGWALWLVCALWLFASRPRDPRAGRLIKGVFFASFAVSLIGMPGQNIAFTAVFWTSAFFLTTQVTPAWPRALLAFERWHAAPLVIAVVCAIGSGIVGWRSFTPALRAARFHEYYAIGVDGTTDEPGHGDFVMHGRRATVVVQPTTRFLKLSVVRESTTADPTIAIAADHRTVVSTKASAASEPAYVTVRDLTKGVVLEAQSSTALDEPGRLRVRWEFLPERQ
ncbi:MAG: hypothetical protein U0Q11_08285 [Vicinamibacterales bacterium]